MPAKRTGRSRIDTRGPSVSSRSLCKYENGETKSKYESTVGIVLHSGFEDMCRAQCQPRPHVAALVVGKNAPRGDFVQRPQAADAESRCIVDAAHVDAGRRHHLDVHRSLDLIGPTLLMPTAVVGLGR